MKQAGWLGITWNSS